MATKRRPILLRRVNYQTGKTDKEVDKLVSALPPGKRRSKNKKIYWETRRNRSDISKRTRL